MSYPGWGIGFIRGGPRLRERHAGDRTERGDSSPPSAIAYRAGPVLPP
ncbi:MAG TPA: hypothetical protein VKZ50_04555 [bacterium]|nr:hypothetical protein [bacterium]